MKFIKLSAYRPKIEKGNINDPTLKQITKYCDDLGPRSPIDFTDVTSEDILRQKLRDYVSSGKVKEAIDKKRSVVVGLLQIDSSDKKKKELSYAERKKLTKFLNNMNQWEAILQSGNFVNDSAFVFLVSEVMIPHRNFHLFRPDEGSIQILKDQMEGSEVPMGKKKMIQTYKEAIAAKDAEDSKMAEIDYSSLKGWICIPGMKNVEPQKYKEDIRATFPDKNFESYENRKLFVNTLCFGKGWCIGTPYYANDYLSGGMIWLYLEAGEPKVCVATERNSTKIREITGSNNRKENVYAFASEVLSFREDHEDMKGMLDGFQYSGHQSISNMEELALSKTAIQRIGAMTSEQIAEQFNDNIISDLAPSSNYRLNSFLLDDKIEECSSDPKFVAAAERYMLSHKSAPSYEHHINRFPFTKDNEAVMKKGTGYVLEGLNAYSKAPPSAGIPSEANPARLNDKLRSIPLKNPNVLKKLFESYMYLLKSKGGSSTNNDRFTQIENMVTNSGFAPQMKDEAVDRCVKSLMEGNIEGFNKIRTAFDLSDSLDKFKEDNFEIIKKSSVKLLVDSVKEFKDLDEFMGGKLTEPSVYAEIQEASVPYSEPKACELISDEDSDGLDILAKRFPNVLLLEEVRKTMISKAAFLIIDAPKQFNEFDKIFGGSLSSGVEYDKIKYESYTVGGVIEHAKRLVRRTGQTVNTDYYKELVDLDKRFKGSILRDEDVYEAAKYMLATHISLSEPKNYKDLRAIFPERFKEDVAEIGEEVYHQLYSEIVKVYIEWDQFEWAGQNESTEDGESIGKKNWNRLNKKTNGLANAKRQTMIEDSLSQALVYARRNFLTWDDINREGEEFHRLLMVSPESEASNSKMVQLRDLNSRYQNKIMQSSEIKFALRDVVIKCSDYKGSPHYDKVSKSISYLYKKLYGEPIVSQSEVERYRKGQLMNFVAYVDSILPEKDKLPEVIRIINSYPQLAQNPRLIFQAKKSAKRFATPEEGRMWTEEEARAKKGFINALDKAFKGQILLDPDVASHMNRNLFRQDFRTDQAHASNWYNISKHS